MSFSPFTDMSDFKLDKRIPVALIATMLAQGAGALVWATQLDARVASVERRVTENGSPNEKFARLEERLDNLKGDVGGVKRQIDFLTQRLLRP